MSSGTTDHPPPPIFDDDEDIFSTPVANQEQETDDKADLLTAASPLIASNEVKCTLDEKKNDLEDPLFADVQDEIDLGTDDKITNPPAHLSLDDSNDQEFDTPVGSATVGQPVPVLSEPEVAMKPATAAVIPGPQDECIIKEPVVDTPVPSAAAADSSSPAQLPLISPFKEPGPSKPSVMKKHIKEEEEDFPLPEHEIDISISEYEKKGDGINAFVVYKVVVKVSNVPGFTKKEYVVWRRFSDFLGLHDKLAVKHLQNGRIVPPPPEKSVVGMTKTKMAKGNTEEDAITNEFLERRRASLERFLRRTSQHPVLLQDPDYRDFLTLETELPKSTQTSAVSGAGVRRMISRVGDAISKIAYRMDETDRWFEEKQNEVEELDESLHKLHSSVEMLVHFRKELATSTDSFSKSMCMLAACEENTALSRAFSQLAETQEKVGLLQHDQAEKDFYILSEMLKDYIALIATVKEVFYERVKVWQNWQSAQQNLTKKREIKTRLELAGKTDKLPAAKKDVQDCEQKVQELEEEFERISKMIRREVRRFNAQRIRDFKHTMLKYLESLSLTQQQCVKYWEAFLPEAKAIIS